MEGEVNGYLLHISGFTGTAGDAMDYHNGMKFSTRDRDNDNWNKNCADETEGGWWYDV